MAKLASTKNGNNQQSTIVEGKSIAKRRSKSLDCIVIAESEPPTPRCPSPTPSSGVDSNKDSPIQIENIDGTSIGMYLFSLKIEKNHRETFLFLKLF